MQSGVRLVWGPPAHIADREVMTRREHRQLADWIVWLERLVRALVVHIALGLLAGRPAWLVSAIAASQRRQTRYGRLRPRVCHLWWPERPATWIARFHMTSFWTEPRRPRAPAPSAAALAATVTPRYLSTLRLAHRYEACCRVLADPRRRARAFAFRLLRIRGANRVRNNPDDLFARLTPPATRRRDHYRSTGPRAADPTLSELRRRIPALIAAFLGRPLLRPVEAG